MAVPYAFANVTTTQNLSYLDANFNYFGNAITVQANTTAMTIDSYGNVGIGTTTPVSGMKLTVNGVSYSTQQTMPNNAGTYNGSTAGFHLFPFSDNNLYFDWTDAGAIVFRNNGINERMRIDSSGNLLVGTTTASAQFYVLSASNVVSGRFQNALTSGTTIDVLQSLSNQAAGTGFYLARFYSAGTPQFAVRGDGTIFAQNTTVQSISDERLKENITDSTDGLNIIAALKPRRFNWKEGYGNNKKNQLGFIAQEVETVFPEAVDVWHMDEENTEEYKSVGASALIPVLVKAIQELKATVDAQAAEITALKAKVGA